ncbi:beta-propeller domain-containing protein [Dehalobacterium formicoaceticum]|uniref:Beta-propeller domain-containing protein n=1 Tax=Dehalobacterium formicoaceticum TaxID=51515 RepID=A0ABT1Y140_9FIRM|nr:beta-propeller domain-containing protein [Dehalobacterium formicoaceticum]MCR6544581.1 beta-propeller domain-containing protein [Dehalobacterium formicoaceticum]
MKSLSLKNVSKKNVKKIGFLVTLLLVMVGAFCLFSTFDTANGQGEIKVICNNKTLKFDVQPRIVDNYVFVPFRTVFEALDAQVTWDEKTGTIKAVSEQSVLEINLHENTAIIKGNKVTLSPKPIIENGQTLLPLRFVSEALYARVSWDGARKTVYIEKNKLPVVGSYQNLKKILESSETARREEYQITDNENVSGGAGAGAQVPASQDMSESRKSADYSTTNIQVEGVDEGDLIKTDGTYIYQVNNNRVVITRAVPAEKMAVTDIINFTAGEFSPQELYVDDKHMVVIGSSYDNRPMAKPGISEDIRIYPPMPRSQTVKAVIYDIRDKNKIKEIRVAELEGSYISSRKVGSLVYLTANKYLDYYRIMNGEESAALPIYRDSMLKDTDIKIPYQDICYFPGRPQPNYLLAAGLDLNHPDKEMKVAAFLGAGQNIYATADSLYAAVTGYQTGEKVAPELNTLVYKFTLDQGEVKFAAQGEVPGTILNQFSMDEHQGFFRIATTIGSTWRSGDTFKNNVYILDGKMKLAGKIEDIAPGERIYSARFIGDRGYMVTFKNVDPLFVLDLKDPRKPKILGALKIPGYSDYLHPYDENHIISFGKDTVELSQKDGQGKDAGTMAFYQGMKIALFDVSDVTHPVQKFQEIIGDRGTDSELLRNHKALLFSREKNLLAFPVTVMEIKNKNPNQSQNNFPDYGEFTFQGAYVYQLDLAKGFDLKGTITHLSQEDYTKAGLNWYSNAKNIERIIYIGDTLYTLSPGMIKANNLNNLTEIMSLEIPQ